MKIISWNVNGLRAVLKKDSLKFIDRQKPEIFCIQETKLQQNQIEQILPNFRHQYWNYASKPGYSGTAVFAKKKPLGVSYGMGIKRHFGEGRIITLEYSGFFLVNVYTPNARRELTRLDYRVQWDGAFRRFLTRLAKLKPVIFCGDLNVAHQEIDLARPKNNRNHAGFTDRERDGFSRILAAGFVDSLREFHPDGGRYTWWSYRFDARRKNIGWRIDYFCLSKPLKATLKGAFILEKIMGSDHCPIGIIVDPK